MALAVEWTPWLASFRLIGDCRLLPVHRVAGFTAYTLAGPDGSVFGLRCLGYPAVVQLAGHVGARSESDEMQVVPVIPGAGRPGGHPSDRGILIVGPPSSFRDAEISLLAHRMGKLPFSIEAGPKPTAEEAADGAEPTQILADNWYIEKMPAARQETLSDGFVRRIEYGYISLAPVKVERGHVVPALIVAAPSEAATAALVDCMLHSSQFPKDLPDELRSAHALVRVTLEGPQQGVLWSTDAVGRMSVVSRVVRFYAEDAAGKKHFWVAQSQPDVNDRRLSFYRRHKITLRFAGKRPLAGEKLAPAKAIAGLYLDGVAVGKCEKSIHASGCCALVLVELARSSGADVGLTLKQLAQRISTRWAVEKMHVAGRLAELKPFLKWNDVPLFEDGSRKPHLYRLPGSVLRESETPVRHAAAEEAGP